MKITKQQLKQLIGEELKVLREAGPVARPVELAQALGPAETRPLQQALDQLAITIARLDQYTYDLSDLDPKAISNLVDAPIGQPSAQDEPWRLKATQQVLKLQKAAKLIQEVLNS
jgi:hypothetical protein